MDIFKAEKTGNLRKIPEVNFMRRKISALPPDCNREGCEAEKTALFRGNKKTGSAGKSTLPGVEAGEESMTASGGSFNDSEVI